MKNYFKLFIPLILLNSCSTQSEFIYKQCNCYYTKKLELKHNDVFILAHDGLTTKEGELPHMDKKPLKTLKNPFPYLYCGIDTTFYTYLNSDYSIRTSTTFTCFEEWE